MNILPIFLRSLLVTSILCFTAPFVLITGVRVAFELGSYLPLIDNVAQIGSEQIRVFLATFGNGQPFEGLIIISLTCSTVGTLFDTYAFYRDQFLRGS